MSRNLGGKWGMECLNTRFPLVYAGNSGNLIIISLQFPDFNEFVSSEHIPVLYMLLLFA